MMGETETTKKKVDVEAIIEESRKIASKVALRISNEPKLPPLSREFIINDRGNVCMNCWEKADYDVNTLICPCFAAASANPSLQIPNGPLPKKANQIPCLAYLFFPKSRKGTSANDLLELFSVYGPVTKVEIPTDANYGLVTFENVDDAERALYALNEQGHFVDWFDWHESALDYKFNVIKTGSSPSNTSSSQG